MKIDNNIMPFHVLLVYIILINSLYANEPTEKSQNKNDIGYKMIRPIVVSHESGRGIVLVKKENVFNFVDCNYKYDTKEVFEDCTLLVWKWLPSDEDFLSIFYDQFQKELLESAEFSNLSKLNGGVIFLTMLMTSYSAPKWFELRDLYEKNGKEKYKKYIEYKVKYIEKKYDSYRVKRFLTNTIHDALFHPKSPMYFYGALAFSPFYYLIYKNAEFSLKGHDTELESINIDDILDYDEGLVSSSEVFRLVKTAFESSFNHFEVEKNEIDGGKYIQTDDGQTFYF